MTRQERRESAVSVLQYFRRTPVRIYPLYVIIISINSTADGALTPVATQTQFLTLLSDIEPSPTTKSDASQAHTDLRKFLRNHPEFNSIHLDTFLSGSYKRDTAIRPRTQDGVVARPDVDIIVVTNHSLSCSPKDVLCNLHDVIEDEYSEPRPRLQARSVGVLTSKADMDVVPIIAPYGIENTLYIPDRKLEAWLVTNPPGHTTWTTQINNETNGYFKPLVKLMKWWRCHHPTVSKRPKGFVIECIVAECMSRNETNYAILFTGLLESIVKRYQWSVEAGTVPWISDPGVPANSVTSSMTADAFSGFYNKVKAHLSIAQRALQLSDSDPEKELELWREIFGIRFPASAAQKAAELLAPAVQPGAISFPDRPVQPRKPGGFA